MEEKEKVEIENKKLKEIIVILEKEESDCKETIEDLKKTKIKNEEDFINEVAEVKLWNVELLDKLQEVETERNHKIKCYEEERKKASCNENRLKEELRQLVDTLKKQEVKVNR